VAIKLSDHDVSIVCRKSGIISDADLRDLIEDLDAKNQESERWEDVIDKKNDFISYNAKCCRPKVILFFFSFFDNQLNLLLHGVINSCN